MDTYIPLISTRSVGPLGLVHLPRLWLKMRLSTKGKLAEDYRAGEGGFDGLLLDALGIAKDLESPENHPKYTAYDRLPFRPLSSFCHTKPDPGA